MVVIGVRQDIVPEKGLKPDHVRARSSSVKASLDDPEVPPIKSDEVIHCLEVYKDSSHPRDHGVRNALKRWPRLVVRHARLKDDGR